MKIKRFSTTFLSSAILIALLASCSGVDTKKTSVDGQLASSTADTPESLIAEGKPTEAAMLYLTLSTRVSSPQRQDIQLKAIDLLTKEKHFETADNLLGELNTSELTAQQMAFFAYLKAKVAVNARNPQKGLAWLDYIKSENYTEFANRADVLRLFISTYELASDLENAILTRILLAPLLQIEEQILLNQQAIIRGLLTLDETVLENIAQSATEAETATHVRAWVNLSLLVKKSKNPFRLGGQLKVWQEQNPQLAIGQSVIASLAPDMDDAPPKLENIALLLPLSGTYSKPATAIRDGFLASYYAQSNLDNNSGNSPMLRIYDTGETNSNILAIYQQAIDNGADIVVGPLRKNAIKEIALNANHNVPTLVLNQLDQPDFYSRNFYQFSLSPEDEARQTAKRAWLDGYNRAVVIFPNNKWGKRVSNAFKNAWDELGGETVTETTYNSKKTDFSKSIKSLLAIDKSGDRRRALSRLLKTRLKFEPRRRQDIDFVFMLAFPKQARLLPPQLKFYHAGNIPIYATSHSFSGRLNRKKDRDIDKVIIGDMPWTLTPAKNDMYKQQIYRTWPNGTRKLNRLYAFGTDSYNILYYLNWLRANDLSTLQGATGKLQMSETNKITRTLSWAKFRKGRPTLLPATAMLDSH